MTQKTALEGVKVLEWSQAATGPWASKCLADFGAEVIKIESTRFPDFMRLTGPYKDNIQDPDRSPRFTVFNTGKKSFTLNIKDKCGQKIFKKLVGWADIVMQNQRPGLMKKIGLGYEELKKVKEDIIFLDVSIVGQDGPLTGVGGWGNNSMGQSGQYYYFRNPGGEPLVAGFTATPDCVTPIFVAMAGIAALDYKNKTGKGQYIDLCQLDVMIHFIGPAILEYTTNSRIQPPVGNRNPYTAPHNVYPCKGEDEWCAVAVFNELEWESLCRVLENPDWTQNEKFMDNAGRKENEDQLDSLISSWTINYTPQEVMEMLQKAGVPSGVVQNAEDIVTSDPQVKARGLLPMCSHPVMGSFLHARWPFIMSKTPDIIKTSPLLGEHNYEICTDILNMTDENFAELINNGVLD